MTYTIQGTVTAVKTTGPEYDARYQQNKYRHFVTINQGGTDYTVTIQNSKEYPQYKQGQAWIAFGPGAEITINEVQQNGQYLNGKASKIIGHSPGQVNTGAPSAPAPGQPAPPQAPAPSAPSQGQGGSVNIDKKFAVGRWVNGAVALVQSGKVATLQEGILEAAKVELWTETHFDNILAKAREALQGGQQQAPAQQPPPQQVPQQQAPAPQQQQPPQQAQAPEFDDDIPF